MAEPPKNGVRMVVFLNDVDFRSNYGAVKSNHTMYLFFKQARSYNFLKPI